MPAVSNLTKRLRRRVSVKAVDWLIANPRILPHRDLRRWTEAIYRDDRNRQTVVNTLKELVKKDAPPIGEFRFEALTDARSLGFESLAGLFASTTLNEYQITMNIRQAAYLFHLIRSRRLEKVIEIGRQWGGTTVLIAAAMNGRGQFWSISDPHDTSHTDDVKRVVADVVDRGDFRVARKVQRLVHLERIR